MQREPPSLPQALRSLANLLTQSEDMLAFNSYLHFLPPATPAAPPLRGKLLLLIQHYQHLH
ncbi:hypothetical protein NQZ68_032567 [Dissostichus eleginoides]|nr:hypothetical protein NQZ68_032567 [Dissostichus eleginoides]